MQNTELPAEVRQYDRVARPTWDRHWINTGSMLDAHRRESSASRHSPGRGDSEPLLVVLPTEFLSGDPSGNRTRAAAVKGRCPNR
jgi:hypothetical protein